MTDVKSNPVTNNIERQRYELDEAGLTAFADYRLTRGEQGEVMVIPHVEAPWALQGTGVAGRLMAGVAAHARASGLKVVPTCPYAAAWFKRYPDEQDLLA